MPGPGSLTRRKRAQSRYKKTQAIRQLAEQLAARRRRSWRGHATEASGDPRVARSVKRANRRDTRRTRRKIRRIRRSL